MSNTMRLLKQLSTSRVEQTKKQSGRVEYANIEVLSHSQNIIQIILGGAAGRRTLFQRRRGGSSPLSPQQLEALAKEESMSPTSFRRCCMDYGSGELVIVDQTGTIRHGTDNPLPIFTWTLHRSHLNKGCYGTYVIHPFEM